MMQLCLRAKAEQIMNTTFCKSRKVQCLAAIGSGEYQEAGPGFVSAPLPIEINPRVVQNAALR